MSKHERTLLSFADALERQESFKYDRSEIIEACKAGAYAINELKQAQETAKIIGTLVIDQRCYRGNENE